MTRRLTFVLSLILFVFFLLPSGFAGESKTLLDTKIVFDKQGKGKVSYKSQEKGNSETTNKIQSALIFYAFAMNQSEDSKRTPLLNQVQRSITQIATDQGLMRPDLLKNNNLASGVKPDAAEKGFDLVFGVVPNQGNSLEVKPIGDSKSLMAPAVFYLFQDMVTNLPDGGLRLMAIALGGMNKWYRQVGKASDPASISQAPSYGLNIAVDILAKVSGKKM